MGSIYSVTQVNSYIKNLFNEDFALKDISIRGEISNCKYHTSGHIYFTLKDGGSVISAVMFAGSRNGLSFALKEGQKVVAKGSVNIYERDGKYQLYAKEIKAEGAGDLFLEFERLKNSLYEMGMFDEIYKKPIPKYAMNIGVVTASTGAAIRDIINIAKRRNPFVKISLYSAIVQGDGAVASIIDGIKKLESMNMDVIIIGRGGGSIEDLWAFNDESLARVIFSCNTPIISAVGHETDTTISDYVSDLRAPTPSAAAEIAVFDYNQYLIDLANCKNTMEKMLLNKVFYTKNKLENLKLRLENLNPVKKIQDRRIYLDTLSEKLEEKMKNNILKRRNKLSLLAEKLNGLSPLLKLDKGFAYISKNSKKINSTLELNKGDLIDISFKDGKAIAEIKKIMEEENERN